MVLPVTQKKLQEKRRIRRNNMGIGGIGIWQILILLIVILLVFGGTKRIKSLGSDLANTIKSFRKTMDEEDKEK